MAQGDGPYGARPTFDVVLRGYDRRQVDDHVSTLESRLAATSGQFNELRLQRDAAASRVHELEQRLSAAPGDGTAQPAAPASATSSLDGLGAKVEAILRLAAQEAAEIRRAAEQSERAHAQAGVTLRATFEGIAERLAPLAQRLDEESTAASAALPGVTSQASSLEMTAQQQAKTLAEAAAANAARMRADAQARVDITARQVADVREELALVSQILSSLKEPAEKGAEPSGPGSSHAGSSHAGSSGAGSAGPGDATTQAAAGASGTEPRERGTSTEQRQDIQPPPSGDGNQPSGALTEPLASQEPSGNGTVGAVAQQPKRAAKAAARDVGTPAGRGAGRGSQSSPGASRGSDQAPATAPQRTTQVAPTLTKPGSSAGADALPSPDAPTETIALPPGDPYRVRSRPGTSQPSN